MWPFFGFKATKPLIQHHKNDDFVPLSYSHLVKLASWLVQGTKTENALEFAGPMYLFERTAIQRTFSTDLRIWA